MSFVVIEGLDGAGTTTQAAQLTAWLTARGHHVVQTHEPTDGPIGRLIRQALRREPGAAAESTLPWMFAADRADHLARRVEPTLAQGGWVVSDRYLHSSLAYQSQVMPLDDVYVLNRTFRVPDLTVFLDIPVDVGLARIDARGGIREIFEERDRLVAIAAAYDRVLELLGERGDPIVRLDGDRSIDQVATAIQAAVGGLPGV